MIKNIKLKDFKVNSFHNKISEDFLILKIKDLGEIKTGNTPSKKDKSNYGNEHNWYTTPDFKDSLLKSSKLKLSVKGFLKARKAKINDILVACIGDLGRVAIVKKEGGFNQQINSISVNENYNYKYIYYFLKNNQDYIKTFSKKNVVDIINKNDFSNIEIYVASDKKEQDKIVEILDKQQSLIDSYKEKLSLLEEQESYYQDELLSGRIRIKLNSENEKVAVDKGFIVNGELVEGKEKEFEEWLSVNFKDKIEFYKENDFIEETINERIKNQKIPKNWKISKVKDFCEVVNGKAFKPSEWDKNKKGLKIVRIQNLKGNKEYNYYNGNYDPKYIINNNDLLFSWSATIASFIWQGEKSLLNQHIFKINLHDDFYKKYFLYILEEIANRANNDAHGGGGMVHIKKGTMENYKFLLPKNKLETLNIILILNNFKNQKNLIKEKIKIEEEKMDYLMNELLSGRIRVE